MKQHQRWQIFFVAFTATFFIFLKLKFLVLRFGDENIYFYMAKRLLEGGLPYRDYFLADPPFGVMFMAGVRAIFGNYLMVFRALPVVLEAVSSIFIYLILKHHKNRLAFLAPFVYLFSFTIMATSDYLTGQLMTLLMILAFWFYEKEKPIASGIMWSLAVLTKMYVAPVLLGFLAVLIWEKKFKELQKIAISGLITTLVVWGPFFVIAGRDTVLFHTFFMHFKRPPGLNQSNVWNYFLEREWFLLALFAGGAVVTRYKKYLWVPPAALFVFFYFFPDIYYNYLAGLFFFIILLAFTFLSWLWAKPKLGRPIGFLLTAVYAIVLTVSIYDYRANVFNDGKFPNAREVASYVKTLNSGDLYGDHTITPLVALLSDRKIFNDYIALGSQALDAGVADKEKISQEAADRGIYLVSRTTGLSESGVADTRYQLYFQKEIFEKYCQRKKEFPNISSGQDNLIVIYKCKR